MLYILILLSAVAILAFFLDWGSNDEFELNSNIIGFGKAKGLYIIKLDNYYVVGGYKIKSKRKAVKEFMKLVEENGFLPPGMYFKRFRQEPSPVKPVGVTKIPARPAPVRENSKLRTVNRVPSVKPEGLGESDEVPQLKNGLKPKRR